MATKQNNNITSIEFIKTLLSGLTKREEEVIRARYGLDGKRLLTLQAIGDKYGITRERVRQIESAALKTLAKQKQEAYIATLVKNALGILKDVGGVYKKDAFFGALKKVMKDTSADAVFAHTASFLLELSGKTLLHSDAYDDWHDFWYVSENDKRRAQGFVAKLAKSLGNNKEEVLQGKNFDAILATTARGFKIHPTHAKNYIQLSKQFATGPFNEFGLATWAEVNPRTARDWAYAILKREKKSMHFREISKVISKHRIEKYTNMQTVHNELIKDNRFVLVGRGLYGLKEHGFMPGTAREVISHVLKEHGPMHPKEVVSKVHEQRILKEGTILINLQNKKNFECMPDGRYCIREA